MWKNEMFEWENIFNKLAFNINGKAMVVFNFYFFLFVGGNGNLISRIVV